MYKVMSLWDTGLPGVGTPVCNLIPWKVSPEVSSRLAFAVRALLHRHGSLAGVPSFGDRQLCKFIGAEVVVFKC